MPITIRTLVEEDRKDLEDSISKDRYHKDYLKSDFFYAKDTYTGVYEIDGKPVAYVRATKSLRIDAHFADLDDKRTNATVISEKLGELICQAKQSGYTEVYVNTASPRLAKFLVKRFGFVSIRDKDVLRKLI